MKVAGDTVRKVIPPIHGGVRGRSGKKKAKSYLNIHSTTKINSVP